MSAKLWYPAAIGFLPALLVLSTLPNRDPPPGEYLSSLRKSLLRSLKKRSDRDWSDLERSARKWKGRYSFLVFGGEKARENDILLSPREERERKESPPETEAVLRVQVAERYGSDPGSITLGPIEIGKLLRYPFKAVATVTMTVHQRKVDFVFRASPETLKAMEKSGLSEGRAGRPLEVYVGPEGFPLSEAPQELKGDLAEAVKRLRNQPLRTEKKEFKVLYKYDIEKEGWVLTWD